MKVLLDENVDWRLKSHFDPAFTITTVQDRGWKGIEDRDLLRFAEAEFDVLVTLGRNLQYQQDLAKYDLAVVVIAARSSSRTVIAPAMPEVNRVVRQAEAGRLYIVVA